MFLNICSLSLSMENNIWREGQKSPPRYDVCWKIKHQRLVVY